MVGLYKSHWLEDNNLLILVTDHWPQKDLVDRRRYGAKFADWLLKPLSCCLQDFATRFNS